jgi:hypothetical protein
MFIEIFIPTEGNSIDAIFESFYDYLETINYEKELKEEVIKEFKIISSPVIRNLTQPIYSDDKLVLNINYKEYKHNLYIDSYSVENQEIFNSMIEFVGNKIVEYETIENKKKIDLIIKQNKK